MKYIELSLTEIEALLIKKKIPFNTPGFYDHKNFTSEEIKNPEFLEIYAAYVSNRYYSEEYLVQAEEIIRNVVSIFASSVKKNKRLGACVDVSAPLSRVLDKLGVWNCMIKGCLTINYPVNVNLPDTHFWGIDVTEFDAPHVWVFAPPFNVIDITIKYQKYSLNESKYLPDYFIGNNFDSYKPVVQDIINPIIVNHYPKEIIIEHFNKQIQFQRTIKSTQHDYNRSKFKYIPLGIGASDVPLEKIQNIKFDNLYPYDFFKKNIQHNIKPIRII